MVARGLLLLSMALSSVSARAAEPTQLAMLSTGMPAEFASMAQKQHVVADMVYGGRPIGQFEAETTPGRLHILHPDQLVSVLPGLINAKAVEDALSGDLDTNTRYLCTDADGPCARPTPDVAAIVYDEARFRIDIYINPKMLAVRPVEADHYLTPANRAISLVDTIGGALTGGDGQSPTYSIRDRAVLSRGDARVVSELSVSSGRGADVDTLVAQWDRPDLRYVAGLYYVPGADLVGRRRIVGAGLASQFDTRADRTLLAGSPVIVFLGQRARVDLYSAGRLMSSHQYEAGNQALDTSSLPDGSYPIEIRIQEAGGSTRTEQRFFTKSAAIPPTGRTVFFLHAGVLAVEREHEMFAATKVPIALAGAARRVGSHLAWDASITGTNKKAVSELGLSFLTKSVQARVAVLGSTQRDYGVLVQAASATGGRLGYNVDLRHVETRGGQPLIPYDDDNANSLASTIATLNGQLAATSYTQMVGNISYRIGRAQFSLAGYLRHDAGLRLSYAVGPTMHWSLLQSQRIQLTFDGSFARTDHGDAVAVGLRLQVFGKRSSLNAAFGGQTSASGGGMAGLAELGGSIQKDHILGGRLDASANLQQGNGGTLLQGSADQRGPFGYASGSLLHRFDGDHSSTQYALSMQTAVAASPSAFRIGTQDQTDSVIAVRLDGAARDVKFEVLVDDAVQGIVRPGGRVTIGVPSYRRYNVRIRPISGDLVAFDTKSRTVDVYPGSVAALVWKADPVVAMFGRMVQSDGGAIANADINTDGAIAATDDRGYFQLQAPADAILLVRRAGGAQCRVALTKQPLDKAYIALGDVICRP